MVHEVRIVPGASIGVAERYSQRRTRRERLGIKTLDNGAVILASWRSAHTLRATTLQVGIEELRAEV